MSLRWGVAGASRISHDFCVALNFKFTPHDHQVIGIASRSKERAVKFAQAHGISKIWTEYENLGTDDQVEVVFVSVLNPSHFEVCKMMIEYGKHVVCARPLGMNRQQVREILELAKKKGVFVMEGLWSRFFPLYRYMSTLLDMKALTNVREVYVKHGYSATEIERITSKKLGGGISLDIGVDAIQFVVFIYKEAPKSIKATGKINSNAVDLFIEVEMIFSGERKANIICSGLQALDNQATVISSRGPICIPDYDCPTKLFGPSGAHEWSLIGTDVPMNFNKTLGLRFEADEVMKCVRSGQLECEIVPMKEMLLIAQIRDEIRKQIGVCYECDRN